MPKMTKIALLVGALALPAYADPPTGASSPDRLGSASALGAKADDGSSQLGAKSRTKPAASPHATKDTGAKDYRVDVDSSATDDKKAGAHKAKPGKAKPTSVKRGVSNRPGVDASAGTGTDHAVNGGINPEKSDQVGVGASVSGDDKARVQSGSGAGAGAEIDHTAAGSDRR